MSQSEPDGILVGKIIIEVSITPDGDEIIAHQIDNPHGGTTPVAHAVGWLELVKDAILHPPDESDM